MLLSLSKIAKGENLTGLLGKTDTDAIDFFIAFSDKFFCIILLRICAVASCEAA